MKVALDRLSRSLHSDVCDSDGCRDAVVHSTISGRGCWRARAASNNIITEQNTTPPETAERMEYNGKTGTSKEEIAELFNSGKIKAPVHLYHGNEDQIINVFKNTSF